MDIEEIRKMRAQGLKADCATALGDTDWQVIRHLEQKAAGLTATLTDEAFAALAQTRQSLRDRYHALLAQLASAQTEEDIDAVKWS